MSFDEDVNEDEDIDDIGVDSGLQFINTALDLIGDVMNDVAGSRKHGLRRRLCTTMDEDSH